MADAELDELRRRAHTLVSSLRKQLEVLEAREFPTESPKEFISYLRRILGGIDRLLAATDVSAVVRSVCAALLDLGDHAKYLSTASYPSIPWTLISHVENLIKAIVVDAKVVLCADWEFNYTVWRVSDVYQKMFEPRKPLFTDSVFAVPPPSWNIVTLPAVDRSNILLHVILGHEVGHEIARRFLDHENEPQIQGEVNNLVGNGKWYDPDINSRGGLYAIRVKQQLFDRILDLRSNGLRELISDIVGFYIFGPSFVLGLREFCLDDVLDALPEGPDYHPPWRYRLRLVFRTYEATNQPELIARPAGHGVVQIVREAVLRQLEIIRELTRDSRDTVLLRTDPLTDRAYRSIERVLDPAFRFVEVALGSLIYDASRIRDYLPDLIERLALGIPPSETDRGITGFRDAILAGACYKTAKLPIPYDPATPWGRLHDERLSQLVHKALEYVEVAPAYRAWRAAGQP